MATGTGYYRDRRRSPRREEPQGDAVTSALAMQIIICALLILIFLLVKKADMVKYQDLRTQYHFMVTDSTQNKQALEMAVNAQDKLREAFETAELYLKGILSRFVKGADMQTDMVQNEADGEVAGGFGYDYLKEGAVFTGALGQGGLYPVELTPTVSEQLIPAPQGATLAPYFVSARLKPPVTGLVTSQFSYRYHPISGNADFHTGIDIAAEEGRTILAALPGEVVEVGESEIYGKYIVLQHATNLRTSYSHCSEIIASVGMAVRQGERIAKVGSTGMSTGPHLHFSVIVEEKFADPSWVLSDSIELVS